MLDHQLDIVGTDAGLVHGLGEDAQRLSWHRIVPLPGVAHQDGVVGTDGVNRLDHARQRSVVPHRRDGAVAELRVCALRD